jgi:hypothetical protein
MITECGRRIARIQTPDRKPAGISSIDISLPERTLVSKGRIRRFSGVGYADFQFGKSGRALIG